MKRTSRILALVAALLAASPSGAHEQGDRAMGVVESVTPDRIVIKAADGHSVAFTVTPDTRFFQGNEPARPEDVRRVSAQWCTGSAKARGSRRSA
jgi:hypothetical protein